jgi:hypothetical protein
MSQSGRARLATSAVLFAALAAGCGFSGRSEDYACQGQEDCSDGRECLSGWCVRSGGGGGGTDGAPSVDPVVCSGTGPCEITCDDNGACPGGVDCAGAESCKVLCSGDGSCAGLIRCGAGNCDVDCTGTGSCAGGVDCSSSCACDVRCSSGCGALSCPFTGQCRDRGECRSVPTGNCDRC